MQGQVIRLMGEKGFGFIRGEDGVERFFHRLAVKNVRFDDVQTGDKVVFEPSQGPKGLRAEDVYVKLNSEA
jgi:cold shock protein